MIRVNSSISNFKDMKESYQLLIIKAVVFIALFVGIDFVVGKVFRFLENKAVDKSPYGMVKEYTMWKVDTDVVIIGASEVTHSYIPSILEDSLDMSVYNCGHDGCRFYYQNAMVRGIMDRYHPKTVLWSISPTYLSSPRAGSDNGLSELSVFYKENTFCRRALLTKSKYEPIKLWSNSYIYNSCLFPYLYNIFLAHYQYDKGYAPLYGSSANTNFEEDRFDEKFEESIGAVFEETCQKCVQNDVDVILIFTPRYKFIDYSNFESYIQLKAIANKYSVTLLENLYHHDELMKAEYFKDNSHLNHKGATIFSKMLAEQVKKVLH